MRTSMTRKLAAAGVAVAGAIGLSAGLSAPSSALNLPSAVTGALTIAGGALEGHSMNFPPGVNGGVPNLPSILGDHFSHNPNPQATQLLSAIQDSQVGTILGQVQDKVNIPGVICGLQIVSNHTTTC